MQVNAFCNTDDITWGTKNLDTKKDATATKSLLKSSMRYASGGCMHSEALPINAAALACLSWVQLRLFLANLALPSATLDTVGT
jgi:hypothetical protein